VTTQIQLISAKDLVFCRDVFFLVLALFVTDLDIRLTYKFYVLLQWPCLGPERGLPVLARGLHALALATPSPSSSLPILCCLCFTFFVFIDFLLYVHSLCSLL
jgi:hypothetical protein